MNSKKKLSVLQTIPVDTSLFSVLNEDCKLSVCCEMSPKSLDSFTVTSRYYSGLREKIYKILLKNSKLNLPSWSLRDILYIQQPHKTFGILLNTDDSSLSSVLWEINDQTEKMVEFFQDSGSWYIFHIKPKKKYVVCDFDYKKPIGQFLYFTNAEKYVKDGPEDGSEDGPAAAFIVNLDKFRLSYRHQLKEIPAKKKRDRRINYYRSVQELPL